MKLFPLLAGCVVVGATACGATRSGAVPTGQGGADAQGGSGNLAGSSAAGAPESGVGQGAAPNGGGVQGGESGAAGEGGGQGVVPPQVTEKDGTLLDVIGFRMGGVAGYPAGMPDGGLVATGTFVGEAQFGSLTLTGAGGREGFVARYAKDGSVLWAHALGGQLDDEGSAVATLSDGSIAVAGFFSGTAVFGRGTPHEVSLHSPGQLGQIDLFVARYGPQGDLLWARQGGGNNQEFALGLAPRPDGGLVLMATVFSDADFSGFLTTHAPGIALASFNAAGALAWEQSFAPSDFASALDCLSVGPDGTTFFCGYSSTAVALWSGAAAPLTVPAPAPIGFLGAADQSGRLKWVNHTRALEHAFGARHSLALPSGEALLVTSLGSGVAFQTLPDPSATPVDGPLLTSAAATQALVFARYHSDGSLAQTGMLAATSLSLLGAAATVDNGFVLTGVFQGSFAAPAELSSDGGDTGFAARFDSAGKLVWLRRAGGGLGSLPYVLTDGSVALIGRVPSVGEARFDRGDGQQTPGPLGFADGYFSARYAL